MKVEQVEMEIEDTKVEIKKEAVESDEEDTNEMDMDTLGPAALGLQRVGAKVNPKPPPTPPIQPLNRRGMPARIRKKNRLFFDDDIVNSPPPRASPKRGPKPAIHKKTPSKISTSQHIKQKSQTLQAAKRILQNQRERDEKDIKEREVKTTVQTVNLSPDRKVGQKIGMRLRNLLKLPKAHKWVCYEWFYSDIDRTLFEGENDFMICLRESFPELKTRELSRVQWTKIRRMMGKPRRCSQSFFEEERKELERKRNKIRALQQRKITDFSNFSKDLPNEIPLQLVIGTKVTARLRKPQDGLFTGSIDAVDTSNNTYRITFERQGLGTHSIPDYEVLANEPPETINLTVVCQKFRPRQTLPAYMTMGLGSQQRAGPSNLRNNNDPLLSGPSLTPKSSLPDEGTLGGFPIKLLELIVRVTKILNTKRGKIKKLKEMNTEAEKLRSHGNPLPEDFERKYAGIVIELERMNRDLQEYLNDVQHFCQEIAPEPSIAAMLAPSHLRERCHEEAAEIVERHNNSETSNEVTNPDMIALITDLTALMLQVKSLSDSDQNAYELKVLEGSVHHIRSKLRPENLKAFQDNIELHFQHMSVGLGPGPSQFVSQKS
ncbi:protein lin-9 homolog isoform X2 [Chrysoperla carnea]|nr:protein lin-9 homolog isoform X2 [Chrysoperla carnea]XP_044727898.1 protein lin-9 homolog isoform X2 [Chrysoperla carnea]